MMIDFAHDFDLDDNWDTNLSCIEKKNDQTKKAFV